jgi:large subunit ribosomal protein L25
MHPYKQLILHIDFQRVDATTKLHMKVPLHFSGDELSPAVKTEGCIANHVMTEIDVLCLPSDLPEFIAVDLSGLKKNASLHLNDIVLPKGVTAVTHGKNNPVVVSVVVIASAEASTGEAEGATPAAATAAAAPAAKAVAGGKAAATPGAKAPAAKAPATKK